MPDEMPAKVRLGGLCVDVCTRAEWAERMVADWRRNKNRHELPKLFFSANGQVVSVAARNAEYKKLLTQADGIDADGMSLVYASRWVTRTRVPERVPTTDFFHDAAKAAAKHGLSFYFLGGTEQANEHACGVIKRMYRSLRIAGRRNGVFRPEEEEKIVSEINATKPDVLWVGMGVVHQERFAVRNRERFRGITWIKTCGGLLDYFNPHIRRAPLWMQNAGLEWLFRTIQEPRRLFWRYFVTNGHAIWLLLKDSGDIPILSETKTIVSPRRDRKQRRAR